MRTVYKLLIEIINAKKINVAKAKRKIINTKKGINDELHAKLMTIIMMIFF